MKKTNLSFYLTIILINILVTTSCIIPEDDDEEKTLSGTAHSLSVTLNQADQIIDVGESCMITAAAEDSENHDVTFTWSVNGEVTGAKTSSVEFSSEEEGSYNISVTVECEKASASADVTITVEQILEFSKTAAWIAGTDIENATYEAVSVSGSTILLGTQFKGVVYSTDGGSSWNVLNNATDGLSNDQVNCTAVNPAATDTWYFGTDSGFSIYDSSTPVMTTYEAGVIIYDIKISGGKIYMATDSGVAVSDTTTISFVYYNSSDGLPSVNINKIHLDGSAIYAATDSGFAYTDVGNLTSWTTKDETDYSGSAAVQAVYADGADFAVWNDPYISVSSDSGANWSTFLSGVGGALTGYAIHDGRLYSVRYGAHLFVSDDNGLNWDEITLPDAPYWFGYNSNGVFSDGSELYIVHNGGLLTGTVD